MYDLDYEIFYSILQSQSLAKCLLNKLCEKFHHFPRKNETLNLRDWNNKTLKFCHLYPSATITQMPSFSLSSLQQSLSSFWYCYCFSPIPTASSASSPNSFRSSPESHSQFTLPNVWLWSCHCLLKTYATNSECPSASANITCYFSVTSHILSYPMILTETFACSLTHSFNKNVLSSYTGPGTMLGPKEYNGKKKKETQSLLSRRLQSRVEERC